MGAPLFCDFLLTESLWSQTWWPKLKKVRSKSALILWIEWGHLKCQSYRNSKLYASVPLVLYYGFSSIIWLCDHFVLCNVVDLISPKIHPHRNCFFFAPPPWELMMRGDASERLTEQSDENGIRQILAFYHRCSLFYLQHYNFFFPYSKSAVVCSFCHTNH